MQGKSNVVSIVTPKGVLGRDFVCQINLVLYFLTCISFSGKARISQMVIITNIKLLYVFLFSSPLISFFR